MICARFVFGLLLASTEGHQSENAAMLQIHRLSESDIGAETTCKYKRFVGKGKWLSQEGVFVGSHDGTTFRGQNVSTANLDDKCSHNRDRLATFYIVFGKSHECLRQQGQWIKGFHYRGIKKHGVRYKLINDRFCVFPPTTCKEEDRPSKTDPCIKNEECVNGQWQYAMPGLWCPDNISTCQSDVVKQECGCDICECPGDRPPTDKCSSADCVNGTWESVIDPTCCLEDAPSTTDPCAMNEECVNGQWQYAMPACLDVSTCNGKVVRQGCCATCECLEDPPSTTDPCIIHEACLNGEWLSATRACENLSTNCQGDVVSGQCCDECVPCPEGAEVNPCVDCDAGMYKVCRNGQWVEKYGAPLAPPVCSDGDMDGDSDNPCDGCDAGKYKVCRNGQWEEKYGAPLAPIPVTR